MKISDIEIKMNEKQDSHISATVSFTMADKIVFFGWQVIKKKAGGVFFAPPQRKIDDKYFPYVRFIDKSWNAEIEKAVMDEYGKMQQAEPLKEETPKEEDIFGGMVDGDDLPF